MKRRITFCCIILMACLSWVSATSRPFSSRDFARRQAQIPQASHNSTHGLENESKEGRIRRRRTNLNEEYRAMSRIGSRPPNCGHKCGGCFPCEAVQIPTTADRLGLQTANYEPEGWKCKCGLSFFNPRVPPQSSLRK